MPNHVDHLIFAVLVAISCTLVSGFEPSPLQDFCVAVNETQKAVFVNGKACKDPKQAQADDFFISGLDLPSNTSTSVGSGSTTLNVDRIPGLNTVGLSISRLDYAPGGGNPPHMHPRATEIALVLEGTIYSGFVTSNPENRLISKVLNKGDVFVLPMGLIHFQQNIGEGNAVVLVAFSSQHPGAISIANAVFGSNPSIDSEILAKAFQVDKSVVDGIKEKFQLANQL